MPNADFHSHFYCSEGTVYEELVATVGRGWLAVHDAGAVQELREVYHTYEE